MTCSHNTRASGCRIERHTHRGHERLSAKNTAKVIIHVLHYLPRPITLRAAVMEEKFCERGEQRRSSSMAGPICDPEQHTFVFGPQPAINIAANLDYRPITSCDLPSG